MWRLRKLMFDRFVHDQRGVVAVFAGLALPVLAIAVAGTVEYASLARRSTQLQLAADEGALVAARELSLANIAATSAESTAKSVTEAKAEPGKVDGAVLTVEAQVPTDRNSVTVRATETVPTFFGKLLTQPTSVLTVSSQSRIVGKMKLCVLALEQTKGGAISLEKSARLTAEGCSVYSDSTNKKGLSLRENAFLSADGIYSAGGFEGKKGYNISRQPLTDSPVIPDPLASRPPPPSNGCLPSLLSEIRGGIVALPPGAYCNGLKITGGARVVLLAGEYTFSGKPLVVDGGSTLAGEYVGLYFKGPEAKLDFKPDSTISLSAPKSGAMAGLLIFEDRTAPPGRDFKITSNDARKLLGTIYLPQGDLLVDATKPVADQSAYTVVVARTITLKEGPNLVLNANYAASDIPVPKGLGPIGGSVTLTR